MATPISPDFDPFLSPPPLTKIHPAFRDETPSPSKPRRLASIINTFRSPKRARSTFDLSTPPPPPPPVPCFSERTNKWKPLPPLPVLRSWSRPAERPITPSRTSFSRPFTPGKRDISGSTEGSRVVSTIDEEPSIIEDAVTDVVDASTEIEATVLVHTIPSSTKPLQPANEAKDDCSDTAGQLYLDAEESVSRISSCSPSIDVGTATSEDMVAIRQAASQHSPDSHKTPAKIVRKAVATPSSTYTESNPSPPKGSDGDVSALSFTSPVSDLSDIASMSPISPESNNTPAKHTNLNSGTSASNSPDSKDTSSPGGGGVPLTPRTPPSHKSHKSAWWLTPLQRAAVYHLCSPVQSHVAFPCVATPQPAATPSCTLSPASSGTLESGIEALRRFIDTASAFADAEEDDIKRREGARLAGMLVQRAVDVCELHHLG